MVRITFVFFLLLGSMNLLGQNQESKADFDEVVWFGLDYTQVKFIGTSDQFNDLEKIQHYYFRSWNELILKEKSKYNLKHAFNVKKIVYAIDSAISRSEHRDMKDIVQTGEYHLAYDQGPIIAKAYSNPEINKVGAIFIMETLNSLAKEETMWLVFFHVSTGQVFHSERLIGQANGLGFRNYWAGGYYNTIKELRNRPN